MRRLYYSSLSSNNNICHLYSTRFQRALKCLTSAASQSDCAWSTLAFCCQSHFHLWNVWHQQHLSQTVSDKHLHSVCQSHVHLWNVWQQHLSQTVSDKHLHSVCQSHVHLWNVWHQQHLSQTVSDKHFHSVSCMPSFVKISSNMWFALLSQGPFSATHP